VLRNIRNPKAVAKGASPEQNQRMDFGKCIEQASRFNVSTFIRILFSMKGTVAISGNDVFP
jgi:hypothetical protein